LTAGAGNEVTAFLASTARRKLDAMVKEATVDCYNEDEQVSMSRNNGGGR